MAKVYDSAGVVDNNGAVLREMPGNDHAAAFAYVATTDDSIAGPVYTVRFCAKRRTGSYEWLSHRCRLRSFRSVDAAREWAQSQPL